MCNKIKTIKKYFQVYLEHRNFGSALVLLNKIIELKYYHLLGPYLEEFAAKWFALQEEDKSIYRGATGHEVRAVLDALNSLEDEKICLGGVTRENNSLFRNACLNALKDYEKSGTNVRLAPFKGMTYLLLVPKDKALQLPGMVVDWVINALDINSEKKDRIFTTQLGMGKIALEAFLMDQDENEKLNTLRHMSAGCFDCSIILEERSVGIPHFIACLSFLFRIDIPADTAFTGAIGHYIYPSLSFNNKLKPLARKINGCGGEIIKKKCLALIKNRPCVKRFYIPGGDYENIKKKAQRNTNGQQDFEYDDNTGLWYVAEEHRRIEILRVEYLYQFLEEDFLFNPQLSFLRRRESIVSHRVANFRLCRNDNKKCPTKHSFQIITLCLCLAFIPFFLSENTQEVINPSPDLEPSQSIETFFSRLEGEYRYNEDGSIIKKSDQSKTTQYIYRKDGSLMVPVKDKDDIIFFIDQFEVTNAQYKKFIEAGDYRWGKGGPKALDSCNGNYLEHWLVQKNSDAMEICDYSDSKGNIPVRNISYYAAQAYAFWAGKSIPTREEWQLAARGKTLQKYPWGDRYGLTYTNRASYVLGYEVKEIDRPDYIKKNEFKNYDKVTPGGYFPYDKSIFNCYDMAGNLSEWCESNNQLGAWVKVGNFQSGLDITLDNNEEKLPVEKCLPYVGFRCVWRIRNKK